MRKTKYSGEFVRRCYVYHVRFIVTLQAFVTKPSAISNRTYLTLLYYFTLEIAAQVQGQLHRADSYAPTELCVAASVHYCVH